MNVIRRVIKLRIRDASAAHPQSLKPGAKSACCLPLETELRFILNEMSTANRSKRIKRDRGVKTRGTGRERETEMRKKTRLSSGRIRQIYDRRAMTSDNFLEIPILSSVSYPRSNNYSRQPALFKSFPPKEFHGSATSMSVSIHA